MLPRLLEGISVMRVAPEGSLGKRRADLFVDVKIGSVRKRLAVEVKRIGEPRFVREALFQFLSPAAKSPDVYPVLAAPYLTESARRLCREAGVGYIDLVGNVYLRFDNILVDKTTPGAIRQERKALRSLSAPKASRVVRTFLSNPGLAYPVTRLASDSGVSPAEAYKVANLLELKGFAQRDSQRRIQITKPGDLLDAWSSSLDFGKNEIVATYSLERTPESLMKATADVAKRGNRPYAFTMLAGASLVVPSIRFYDVACYVADDVEWWTRKLDLKEVETGSNLQLVVPRDEGVFQGIQEIGGLHVVSNVQLYADLLSGPARGQEQAEMLRKRKLGF